MKAINFKLKKPFGEYKKGEVFSHFKGTVHGISDAKEGTAYFENRKLFKMVKNQPPTK